MGSARAGPELKTWGLGVWGLIDQRGGDDKPVECDSVFSRQTAVNDDLLAAVGLAKEEEWGAMFSRLGLEAAEEEVEVVQRLGEGGDAVRLCALGGGAKAALVEAEDAEVGVPGESRGHVGVAVAVVHEACWGGQELGNELLKDRWWWW